MFGVWECITLPDGSAGWRQLVALVRPVGAGRIFLIKTYSFEEFRCSIALIDL